ncbi:hypothetical protein FB451DRAFT_1237249, partial [Mycena latifolia]
APSVTRSLESVKLQASCQKSIALVHCAGFTPIPFLPSMSSFNPPIPLPASAPWGSWSLDYQFLSDLNGWTADNPAENTLYIVLQSISGAIEGSKPYFSLIPSGLFPAQSLVLALGTLIQFGVNVAQVKQEVLQFAQDTVEWITRIADIFNRHREVGRLLNLRARFLRGAVFYQEIGQFKENLAQTTKGFKVND